MTYNVTQLNAFLDAVVERGMRIDLEGGLTHKEHEVDLELRRPPIKLDIATADMREGARMTDADMDMLVELMWGYMKRTMRVVPNLVGVPKVGESIAERLQKRIERDGKDVRRIILGKRQEGAKSLISHIVDHGGAKLDWPTCLVDDLSNRGLSKVRAVNVVRASGYQVTDVLVGLDYEQDAKSVLLDMGVVLHNLAVMTSYLLRWELKRPKQEMERRAVRDYLSYAKQVKFEPQKAA